MGGDLTARDRAGAPASAAARTAATRAALERTLETLFGECRGERPGAVVGVAHRGELLYRGAFGLANVEHGVALTPATRMPIASVTKHFACAVALCLAAERRLSLEDPIGRWLPELRDLQARPTLRQLMTHTGGLRCFLELAIFNGVRTVPAGYPLATQLRQRGVNFAPGEGFLYSNGGYYLLSLALERASGRTFAELVRDYCLAPAGMHATAAPRRPWPVERDVATQYAACDGSWRHVPGLLEEHLGDGSMVSTVDDLLAWLAYLRGGGGAVTLDMLTPTVRLAGGEASAYGLGLITDRWRGVRLVHHGGLLLGASCMLLTAPDEELDVFVGCNSPAPVRAATLAIVETVLGDRLEPAHAPPRTADHAALLGRYLSTDGGVLADFVDANRDLAFATFGMPAQALVGVAPHAGYWPFAAPGYSGPIRFAPASAPDEFDCVEPGLRRRFRRLAGDAPSAADVVRSAEGEFESAEAGATLSFSIADAAIRVRTRGEYGRCDFHATVIDADALHITPVDYASGWLVRLERAAGRVEAVVLSSGRTRKLRFERSSRAGRTDGDES